MPKNRLVTRSSSSARSYNMTLSLECAEEPLSEAQLMLRVKCKENHDRVTATLEELIKDHGGKLVCRAGSIDAYQYTLPANQVPTTTTTTAAVVKSTPQGLMNLNQSKGQAIKLNMLNNSTASQGNIQLVVDPCMGVILSPVCQAQATSTTNTTVTSAGSSVATHSQTENYKYTRSGRRTKVLQVQQPDVMEEPAKATTPAPPVPSAQSTPSIAATRGRQKSGCSTHVVTPTTTSPQGVTNLRIKTVNKQQPGGQSVNKPTEHTSIGGISVGSKNAACEQIDESKKNLPDGREITFNKMNGGRTFPSLVVVARPNFRTKDIAPQIAQKERSELDVKVKSVLMFSATKFAEWLIQQGLVRSEQYCLQHSSTYQKAKLKLGMYSDQGAPYTPTVLLKLIYHWACQTNVQNVVSWVKVSNIYVKNFYTNLRSVCTAAVWDKSRMMGGKNSMIQVGVISLGTTSQDGNLRQVKVEVLGVLDLATLDLRLRACDPVQDGDRSYKRRFNNILHPLKEWVHADSKIMTDFTVDKSTLQEMGFNRVTQSAFSDQNPRNFLSNYHIMEYLRKIVPRMFQNTLSLLSRQMIQQFLDELVWREMYGSTASRAFDNIVLHIAEQTRVDSNDNLPDRLVKIAANPFQDWSYSGANSGSAAGLTSKEYQQAGPPEAVSQKDLPQVHPGLGPGSGPGPGPGPGPRRGRKRALPPTKSPDPESEVVPIPAVTVGGPTEPKKTLADLKGNGEKEKEREGEEKPDQIQLQEFYYATMEGDKDLLLKERKGCLYFKCFLCPTTMRSNTEVMQHMISHVPPQVPGRRSDSPVCRYCCTAFSANHQVITHVTETHSNFGHSDSGMVVCAICEQKFGNGILLIDHLSSMHYPSEMPYRCESCGYRTSSHKDAIDHFYQVHEKGEGLQCPYCLKVIQFVIDGNQNGTGIHAFLLHMQRHAVRKEQGRGNKCARCCLWFNQKSSLRIHQRELHDCVSGTKVIPYSAGNNGIMISKQRHQNRRFDVDSPVPELPRDERVKKWSTGPITVHVPNNNLPCQECEEDIDEQDHYPGEQKCQRCRYVTCCWRAFKEHQQQIHNERPMTGLVVPSPLINIPLDRRMQCPCGYTTIDGNRLATHLIKCRKISAYPTEDTSSGMLNSLGLVPKTAPEEIEADKKMIYH